MEWDSTVSLFALWEIFRDRSLVEHFLIGLEFNADILILRLAEVSAPNRFVENGFRRKPLQSKKLEAKVNPPSTKTISFFWFSTKKIFDEGNFRRKKSIFILNSTILTSRIRIWGQTGLAEHQIRFNRWLIHSIQIQPTDKLVEI